MAVHFGVSDEQVATYEPRFDEDGSVWRQAVSHGALTKDTAYRLTSTQHGPVTEAMSSSTTYYRVIVPEAAVASSTQFWGQTGGFHASMVTPSLDLDSNDGLGIDGAAIADLGAYAEQGEAFAIMQGDDNGTSATAHNVMLLDREILEAS